MTRPSRRPDITPLLVAEMWLKGMSLLAIATQLDAAMETIRRRLHKARDLHPDLPWEDRKVQTTHSAATEYVKMNDGVPWQPGHQAGSIVNSRSRRPRL